MTMKVNTAPKLITTSILVSWYVPVITPSFVEKLDACIEFNSHPTQAIFPLVSYKLPHLFPVSAQNRYGEPIR